MCLSGTSWAVCLILSFCTTALTGQQAPPRTPERGADLLSIQFTVVGPDGTPVTDLRGEEVSIRLGGRIRPVRSLQFITADEPVAANDVSPLPPPFATNASSNTGRTFVVVIDENSFRPGREGPLREAVDGLLAKLGPADRIALVTLPYGGVKARFTSDFRQIRAALSQVVGQAPATETGSELACRTRRTLETLEGFLHSLGVRELPATMLFVTAALAAPRRDAVSALPPGMCELPEHLFTRVAIAAGAARTQFYVIRPGDAPDRGSSVQRETAIGSDNPMAGIDHLIGATNGKLLALTGSTGTALDRIARETAGYYVAAVDTLPGDPTGRTQQLDVRISRRAVELRSLPQITLARADPAAAKLIRPSLRDMVSTRHVFRDLPLRAAGFPALGSEAKTVRIVTVAEPVEPGVVLESVGAVLVDKDNRIAAQWVGAAEEVKRRPVVGAMSAPPGLYRMRVAAIDTTGRSGTVDYEVTAEVVRSGPLRLSSVVVGLNREGGFSPRLQFVHEPLAIAYIELEGGAAGSRVNAALEVAQTLNGPAIVSVPLAISSAGENRYAATGPVPVGALPAGDYIVRALIGIEGGTTTRVVQTLRKALPVK